MPNCMIRCTLFSLAMIFCFPVLADSDTLELKQQLEEINQRVVELERRLNALEAPEVRRAVELLAGPQNPGDSEDGSNWRLLKIGYDYPEVKELLGEPQRIKKGLMEFWFYSDQGMKGPYVKFLNRKVNAWRAPE